jgi:diguanylate cyclase (GGDEF)-like protein/PAS domain S-box-containing protein
VSYEDVSPDAQPFRRQGLGRRLLPFGVVASLAMVSLALPHGLYSWGWFVASAILLILVVVGVLLPWERLPRSAAVVVPVLYVAHVMSLGIAAGPSSGVGIVVLAALIWTVLYHQRWESFLVVAAIVITQVVGSYIPVALHSDVLLRRVVFWSALGIMVSVATHALRDRVAATLQQREELDVARVAALAEIREAHEFSDSLVENIPNMIFVKEAEDLRLVRLNRAGELLLGYERSELLGEVNSAIFPLEQAEFIAASDREALAGEGLDIPEQELTTRSGEVRYLHTQKIPIRDAEGRPRYLLGIAQDVTERKRMDLALKATNEQMAETIAALQRRNRDAALLSELGELLQGCSEIEETHAVTAHSCEQLFAGHSGGLSLLNPSKNLLEKHSAWGPGAGGMADFGPQDCWALRLGRLHESGESGPSCKHLEASVANGSACLPMIGQGETIGLFQLLGDGYGPLDDDTRQLLLTVGEHIALAMANFQLRVSLRNQSIRDPLTNLFNRRYMEETLFRELSRANRNREPLGIIQIDVDHFKPFNDLHGHQAGDAVLRALGELFLGVFRDADVACRYGGEEFTVILPGSSLDATEARAHELAALVAAQDIQFRNISLEPPTLSIGVAVFPTHDRTAAGLIRVADAALYAAKHNGRNQIVRAPVPVENGVPAQP